METIFTMLACVLSYLVGSVPSGLIFGKLIWNIDLREHGSHNIGATNAWRTIGKPAGILIFAFDFLKGVIGVGFGAALSGTPLAQVLGGIFAIIGHSCSLLLGFKGGKGVATGLGVIAMLMPKEALIVFLIWLAIVRVTRYVSLGSIVAAACAPILAWLFGKPAETVAFGVVAAIFIIYRHQSNIERLLSGTESRIEAAKR
ncbi:MAG: glycerol-3-phosphate 1-O-acyltransferase PlsY [Oscillospiraceae bacterium]|nr:glycerol-3-phosphate 1-O-acyltransferase PlsY [Oscillospiraceae bacterium]